MRDGVTATLASGVVSQVKSRDAVHHASASAGASDRGRLDDRRAIVSQHRGDRLGARVDRVGRAGNPHDHLPLGRQFHRVGIGGRAPHAIERRQRIAEAGAGDAQRRAARAAPETP